jgi:mannose-1-phosphate guanylyltransferase
MAETWTVVLAGGEGSRLRMLTTTREGRVIPKQYCSIRRSSCLLQDALTRARTVTMPSHVCTVVAVQHRQWWTSAVSDLNELNVFVQPQNQGTAYGIALALLKLEMRNPGATVVILPADHYYRDENVITRVLRIAGNLAGANPRATYLLGAEPEGPDAELGYILPAERVLDKPAVVLGFTEKPNIDYAQELLSLGALWNLFILVGSVGSLLQLFEDDYADTVRQMREALKSQAAGNQEPLDRFYAGITPIDFSRDVLEVQATRLQVIRVPNCGWTDLGTPQRVEAAVRSMNAGIARRQNGLGAALFFDLCAQYPMHKSQAARL